MSEGDRPLDYEPGYQCPNHDRPADFVEPMDGKARICCVCFSEIRDGKKVPFPPPELRIKIREDDGTFDHPLTTCPACDPEAARIHSHRRMICATCLRVWHKGKANNDPCKIGDIPRKEAHRVMAVRRALHADALTKEQWKDRDAKRMKIRIESLSADSMSGGFRVVDVETGRELPICSLEILPITCDRPLIQARMTIEVWGGIDIFAEGAAVPVLHTEGDMVGTMQEIADHRGREMTPEERAAAPLPYMDPCRVIEPEPFTPGTYAKKIDREMLALLPKPCPYCGRDDGTHPRERIEKFPCSGWA